MDRRSSLPRILMIGPVPPRVSSLTNPIGGTGVHFLESIRELGKRDVCLQVVDTTRPRTNIGRVAFVLHAAAKILQIAFSTIVHVRSCDLAFISLTASRAWVLASLFWLICTCFGRPVMLRIFGGEFDATYDRYSSGLRWWADHTFMRSERIYVQTRAIRQRFGDRPNVRWFPNTRDVGAPITPTPRTAKRFLLVAQLRKEKGLYEALEACRCLPDGCRLTVYGPRVAALEGDLFDRYDNASYGGTLHPQEVPAAIAQHDVVLLPTYFWSEGYPGVIIEAFQCGRPVISTWWRSIPELVRHHRNGLLVSPRSSTDLHEAMLRLAGDPVLYRTLCDGALATGDQFRSPAWYDRLVGDIVSICTSDDRTR